MGHINSINVKLKKLQEENIGTSLYDPRFGKDFLDRTPKGHPKKATYMSFHLHDILEKREL